MNKLLNTLKNCPECGAKGGLQTKKCNCGFIFLDNEDYSKPLEIPLKYTRFKFGYFLIGYGFFVGLMVLILSFFALFFLFDIATFLIYIFSSILWFVSSSGLIFKKYWAYITTIICLVWQGFSSGISILIFSAVHNINGISLFLLLLCPVIILFSMLSVSYLKERKHMFINE